MARAGDGRLALVELKAVDGTIRCSASWRSIPNAVATCWPSATARFGAAVDSTLLARLDLKIGDRVTSAARHSRSAAWSTEPDKLGGSVGLGPRFLVSEAGLRATDCCSPAAWCAGSTG
jgi:putative ABC transport system permease protein